MAIPHRIVSAVVAAGAVAGALGLASGAVADVVPGQILVQYRAGASTATRADVRADADVARTEGVTPQIDLLQAPAGQGADALAALRDDPRVVAAAPNAVLTEQTLPNDPLFNLQWAPGAMNLPTAWGTTANQEGAVVAVIDSGIQADHPDLADVVMTPAVNWIPGGITNSHGTHVAGIIGAEGDNGIGVAGVSWRGAAGARHLMDLHIIWGNGTADTGDLLDAMDYAGAHGARVVNGSLGGSGETAAGRALYQSVADTYPNTLYVFAAGNSGADLDQQAGLFLPCETSAVSPNVLCVSATTGPDTLASYSNRGSAVTIAAPGTDIESTKIGSTYGLLSGTSMAAPQVSGAASLLFNQRPTLTGAQARTIIQATGRAVPGLATTVPGGGVVDANAALGGLDPALIGGPTAFGVSAPAPGGISETATPTVQWTASTSQGIVTSYTVEMDGAVAATVPWHDTSWTSPQPLANGAHTVRVIATDTLGRTAATAPFTINVQVPAEAPAASPPTPAAPATPRVSKRAAALAAARLRYARARTACRRKPTRATRTSCNRAATRAYNRAVAKARRLPA